MSADTAVKVAVRAESYTYDKPYTYLVPEGMNLLPGERVIVPFGAGNRPVQAIVLDFLKAEERSDPITLKSVLKQLDSSPVISSADIGLMLWLRDRCFCTCYDVLRAMLPVGLDFKTDITYRPVDPLPSDRKPVSRSRAYPLYEYIAAHPEGVLLSTLEKIFPGDALHDSLNSLIRKKLIASDRSDIRVCSDKKIEYVSLVHIPDRLKEGSPSKKIVDFLYGGTPVSIKEVCYYTGVTSASVRRLIANGTLDCTGCDAPAYTYRINAPEQLLPLPVLNGDQQSVFNGLVQLADDPDPHAALLYGVTGSGKTYIYIRLADYVLSKGQSAIILVPEIALTPQLLSRFASYFGNQIAVIHSSLSVRERFEQWKRIKNGEAKVVIGTRSAVFAPVQDLGLIILDEEQEYSYYSESSPRYHARDVARYRVAKTNSLLLLGSATPSVETMYHALSDRFSFFRLDSRFGQAAMPDVTVSNMSENYKNGNTGCIGTELYFALKNTFENGHQAILFLNRRGNSRSILCHHCGKTVKCPNCSVALTYHSANNRLMCHYCGYSRNLIFKCPECGSGSLSKEGGGTQKAEDELKTLFPDIEILRMDADTTNGITSHETILNRFKNEKIPILLGTQMIAKGLDFPNVTLVGVLDADQMINMPGFRSAERAFSMITQASGRSGRGQFEGKAIIQTSDPDNETVIAASKLDYDSFYKSEIVFRQAFGYPPFKDLVSIEMSGLENTKLLSAASAVSSSLEQMLPSSQVFAPIPAPVFKVRNRYRYRITVKTEVTREVRSAVSAVIRQFLSDRMFNGIGIYAVINPLE